MDTWTDYAYLRIAEIAKLDPDYQQILQKCSQQEAVYLQILAKLQEEERIAVDDYVTSCEELLYRLAQLAYQFGNLEGSTGK